MDLHVFLFGIPLNTFHVFFSEWLSPTQHWVAFQAWIKKDKELESTLLATQKYTWFANVASSLGRTIRGKEGTTFFDWKEQYDQRCRVVDLYNRFSSPQSQPQKMYGYNIYWKDLNSIMTMSNICLERIASGTYEHYDLKEHKMDFFIQWIIYNTLFHKSQFCCIAL